MAIKITEECINCGACEIKCPNKAIYEGGKEWSFSYGITDSQFKKNDGQIVGSFDLQKPNSDSVYYIVTEKCTECIGFHDEPQCISVCPIDCCIPDENFKETKEELKEKKKTIQIR